MKESFVKRMARDFFDGKTALLTATYKNCGQEEILKDNMITIISKNPTFKTKFNIKDKNGIFINGISCDDLELINE